MDEPEFVPDGWRSLRGEIERRGRETFGDTWNPYGRRRRPPSMPDLLSGKATAVVAALRGRGRMPSGRVEMQRNDIIAKFRRDLSRGHVLAAVPSSHGGISYMRGDLWNGRDADEWLDSGRGPFGAWILIEAADGTEEARGRERLRAVALLALGEFDAPLLPSDEAAGHLERWRNSPTGTPEHAAWWMVAKRRRNELNLNEKRATHLKHYKEECGAEISGRNWDVARQLARRDVPELARSGPKPQRRQDRRN